MTKMCTRRPEDLGGMGESFFRMLTKDAGLVANSSSDDKAGWDFEVEAPSSLAVNYSSQSKPVYRVQVKATMGNSLSVTMTYSNLLSLIQFGGPAFIFLVRFGKNLMPESCYLLHIDEARTLELLTLLRKRQVANARLALNKAKAAVSFGEETRLKVSNECWTRRSMGATLATLKQRPNGFAELKTTALVGELMFVWRTTRRYKA